MKQKFFPSGRNVDMVWLNLACDSFKSCLLGFIYNVLKPVASDSINNVKKKGAVNCLVPAHVRIRQKFKEFHVSLNDRHEVLDCEFVVFGHYYRVELVLLHDHLVFCQHCLEELSVDGVLWRQVESH